MEGRFGHEFDRVRIHTDAEAARSARAIHALAYTRGHHIVMGADQYRPDTSWGDQLIAHEIVHTMQQSDNQASDRNRVISTPSDPAELEAEQIVAATTPAMTTPAAPLPFRRIGRTSGRIGRQTDFEHQVSPLDDPRAHPPGAPGAVTCGPSPGCPPSFCQPYSNASFARHQLAELAPALLLGIAAAVDRRVVGLWRDHLWGGSAPRDLSMSFGDDFRRSKTTASRTRFLLDALRRSIMASPPPVPSPPGTATVSLQSRISSELAAIGTAGHPERMNFDYPAEVPGNIAGDIGTDQLTCKAGAMPSPFNDERRAEGDVALTQEPSGALRVAPTIRYHVRDTIDLCPGNCGTSLEQLATIPISQFEATGISGDVPFSVDFSVAPTPFVVAPAAATSPAPP